MGRREAMRRIGAAGAVTLLGRPVFGAENRMRGKPDIVIIVADDLGWNDVGYHGSEIKTPHIDRIAAEGVQLDRFYACPICSPTRAGLMTGRWPLRFGIMRAVIPPWRDYGLPPEEETLPEMLARAGYKRRGCFGKWHLGHSNRRFHPIDQGFTHFYGCYNGAIDYFTHMREGELDWHRQYAPAREEGYSTTLLAQEAAKFIADSPADPSTGSGRTEPFFCYLPFNAPHTPLQAPPEYLQKYAHLKGQRQKFAAMVACMDDGIGRVLRALDEKGIADNTIVLFFSDNGGGPGASNTPLR
ncbi:MAG: sulfatase-like hydrolase/transferase, partial [Phycisphaerae bacterium]